MQRVAIARALVNNPDIILTNESTGALDSQTNLRIMEILKEIAKTRLVVMVTHNKELADSYSNRIVNLLNGEVQADTNPVKEEALKTEAGRFKRTSMSFLPLPSFPLKTF